MLPALTILIPLIATLLAANTTVAASMDEWKVLHPLVVVGQNQTFQEVAPPLLGLFCVYVFSNYLAFAAQQHMLDSVMVDETTALFLQGIVKWGSLVIAGSVILRALGFQTSALEMILGGSGVALAFASQQLLKNFAAGCMILLLRPFQVGDRIQTGSVEGTVISVGLLETVILTNAGVRIWYDNGSVKETFLRNLSQHGMRRIECDVTVSPKADVKATRTALEQAIEPFQELWKQEGTHASAAEEAKPSDVPQGPRTVREAILQQYPELLSMLAGTLAAKQKWKATATCSKVAKAGPGCIGCSGANNRGIEWCAYIWVPHSEFDSTVGAVKEAMLSKLQEQGIEIAVLGHRA